MGRSKRAKGRGKTSIAIMTRMTTRLWEEGGGEERIGRLSDWTVTPRCLFNG